MKQKMLKIKELCQQLDIVPTKRKGQNFLVNEKILDKIIAAANLKSDDIVLEIGPGLGHLTEKLAQKAKKVIAVELDRKLAAFLKEKFEHMRFAQCSPTNYPAPAGPRPGGGEFKRITNKTIEFPIQKNIRNIKIIQGDILKFRISDFGFRNYKLVANLPYNITGAVLRRFLGEEPKPKLMVLMLQKEVAERILAKNQKYAIISLMVNLYGRPEIVGFVSKNYFWPKPKIDSAILKITLINTDRKRGLTQINEKKFFQLIRQGFSHPRKQLIGNLKKIKEKSTLEVIFNKIGLNLKIRAEKLSLEKWLQIYYYIYEE